MSYTFNKNPNLPSLEALQSQVDRLYANPLGAGYICYTGYKLTEKEAESLNGYVEAAMVRSQYNDQERLDWILNRRHQMFVMIAEEWEYVVGLGRYAHPAEAKEFKKDVDSLTNNN